MRRKFFVLLAFIYWFNSAYGTIQFNSNNPVLDTSFVQYIFEKAEILTKGFEKNYGQKFNGKIFEHNGNFYFQLNGLSHVFIFENGDFQNLYTGNFHGFNFDSYTFIHDQKIHNYGGTGFWQNNGNLIYFDTLNGHWDYVYSTRKEIDIIGSGATLIFYENGFLYFLIRDSFNPLRQKIENKLELYSLDLSNFKLKKFNKELSLEESVKYFNYWGSFIETKDYLLGIEKSGINFRIFNKSKFTYKDIPKKVQHEFNFNTNHEYLTEQVQYILVHENIISFYDKDFIVLDTGNIKNLYNLSIKEQVLFKESSLNYWIFLALLLVFPFLFYRLFTKKQPKFYEFPYPKLLEKIGATIEQDELDICLEIQNLSYNSARNKRSQILKEISIKYGDKVKIGRIQDEKDGRQFRYKINN
ncbi:MAG: hypothetical protein RJA52_197 [Bacteroidota bacterium]